VTNSEIPLDAERRFAELISRSSAPTMPAAEINDLIGSARRRGERVRTAQRAAITVGALAALVAGVIAFPVFTTHKGADQSQVAATSVPTGPSATSTRSTGSPDPVVDPQGRFTRMVLPDKRLLPVRRVRRDFAEVSGDAGWANITPTSMGCSGRSPGIGADKGALYTQSAESSEYDNGAEKIPDRYSVQSALTRYTTQVAASRAYQVLQHDAGSCLIPAWGFTTATVDQRGGKAFVVYRVYSQDTPVYGQYRGGVEVLTTWQAGQLLLIIDISVPAYAAKTQAQRTQAALTMAARALQETTAKLTSSDKS
jgi:hypothetical protein